MLNMVILPGLNNDSVAWNPVIESLPSWVGATALDMPPLQSIPEIADHVAETLPGKSIIVGHSFGGCVAIDIAERHSDKVAGLVLVNAMHFSDSEETKETRRAGARRARDGAYEEMATSGLDRLYFGDRASDPNVHAERLRSVRAYGAERFFAHVHALVERTEKYELLSKLPIPVLVLAAEHDVVAPTEGQRAWARTIGASYEEIPATSHMLPAEEPEKVSQVVASWLERENLRSELANGESNVSAEANGK